MLLLGDCILCTDMLMDRKKLVKVLLCYTWNMTPVSKTNPVYN